ncbi:unnamed protein product [Musa acuminata subsp. burmannicoides]
MIEKQEIFDERTGNRILSNPKTPTTLHTTSQLHGYINYHPLQGLHTSPSDALAWLSDEPLGWTFALHPPFFFVCCSSLAFFSSSFLLIFCLYCSCWIWRCP